LGALAILVHPEKLPSLKAVAWQEVGETAYRAMYEKMAPEFAADAAGIRAEDAPMGTAAMAKWAREKLEQDAGDASDLDLAGFTARVIGILAILHLVAEGWTMHTSPGETITVSKDSLQVEPLKTLSAIARDEASPDSWRALCATAGLTGVPLGRVA
jgi:hypothetical protein